MFLPNRGFALAMALLAGSCGHATALTAPPAQSAEADEGVTCNLLPPTGYTVEIGYGRGTEPEALAAARAQAGSKLAEKVCAGLTAWRCDEARRQIKPWDDDYNKKTKSACALAAIEKVYLDGLQRDQQAFDAEIVRLSQDFARAATTAPLLLDPPAWKSGCVAGEVGQALHSLIQNNLSRYPEVRLAAEPLSDAKNVNMFHVELSPMDKQVVLDAQVLKAGDKDWTIINGFRFPSDLFDIADGEMGDCRSNSDLGLQKGERLGEGDLRVQVVLGSTTGVLCEGSSIEPKLTVSRPARVRVYSVAEDGRGFLVWPPPGETGFVTSQTGMGTQILVSVPGLGDERLVAVAVAEGQTFGSNESWQGFCKVPGTFGADIYPKGSAVGSATFKVMTGGSSNCPVSAGATTNAQLAQAAIDGAPACR